MASTWYTKQEGTLSADTRHFSNIRLTYIRVSSSRSCSYKIGLKFSVLLPLLFKQLPPASLQTLAESTQIHSFKATPDDLSYMLQSLCFWMESAPFLRTEWHCAMNLSTKSITAPELFDALGWKQHIYILFVTHLSGFFSYPKGFLSRRGNSSSDSLSPFSQPLPFYSSMSQVALVCD